MPAHKAERFLSQRTSVSHSHFASSSKTQRHRGYSPPRAGDWTSSVPTVPAFQYGIMGAWDYGCMGLWVHGIMGAWDYGCVGLWVQVMGAWDNGCMGLWDDECGAQVAGE